VTHVRSTPTSYRLDSEILQRVGPGPAVVHAILAANDNGDGTRMTHKQLAKAAGITHISTRRAIDKAWIAEQEVA
jgi:hypothetical protein